MQDNWSYWNQLGINFGEESFEDKLHLMVWVGQISWRSIVVGFWHVWAQPCIIKIIMLTNTILHKHMGCHQTKLGISSPPDCGARKYPHGASRAADSGHTLFRERRGSLLRWRGEPQPRPRPNSWGRNPFFTPFPCHSVDRASLYEWSVWYLTNMRT